MQFDNHESDLYILPENARERNNLQSYCKTKGYDFKWCFSNVKGQAWYGKQFLEIPFGLTLKNAIIEYMEITK